MNQETKLLVKFDSGDANSQELVEWAIQKIQNGFESMNLNELAWQDNPPNIEARELFINSIEDLSLTIPSRSERQIILAKTLATKIVEGKLDANDGCSKIAEISRELDSPGNLSIFELLSHEQYDHEDLGITAENIKPSILEEAKKLAGKI